MACSRFFAVVACAALLASAVTAKAESTPEAIGKIIDAAVDHVRPCKGLAIGATQGNVRAQRFYGHTGNHGPPAADTLFGIGSITKTFTATLLAFEDQRGEMHLDDPLARYAPPDFRVPDFDGKPILLVHLAEHTSGLPRRVPNPPMPMPPERLAGPGDRPVEMIEEVGVAEERVAVAGKSIAPRVQRLLHPSGRLQNLGRRLDRARRRLPRPDFRLRQARRRLR